MRRTLWIALIVGALSGFGLSASLRLPQAVAQRTPDVVQWDYKVGVFYYNPGERMTDERRAAVFERELNEQARQGWEAVGTVLTRDTVQTVGGAITTRDSTSFIAYRRRR
jgi:sensor histidine kinase regulating citrate/malate metabolism